MTESDSNSDKMQRRRDAKINLKQPLRLCVFALKNNLSLFWLGILLLVGLGLRLSLFFGYVYHIDEFFSMLAAKMVAEKGWPILPSGLLYDQGLTLSYLAGGLIALLDFRVEVARWPSMLFGIVTIATYYALGQRLFSSRWMALLLATLITFDSLSILWTTRARMYVLAHFFVLLTLFWLWQGFFNRPSRRGRYLCLSFLLLALLSHTVSFLIILPLSATLLIFSLFYRWDWLKQKGVWLDGAVAIVALSLVLALVAVGQTSSTNALEEDVLPKATAETSLGFLSDFVDVGLSKDRFDEALDFINSDDYSWLIWLVLPGLWLSLYRLKRKKASSGDMAFLFCSLFGALVILEMGGLLTSSWRKDRYLFIIFLPALFLSSGFSLGQILQLVLQGSAKLAPKFAPQKAIPLLGFILGTALILGQWGPKAIDTAQAQGTGHYDTAFAYVSQHIEPGDRVMTFHPAAAELFYGSPDYYVNQETPLVLPDPSQAGLWVDRYSGSPLVDSVEQFNAILAESERVWFVVDVDRLYNRYETLFAQQVLAQMSWVYQAGEVYVFFSEVAPNPISTQPQVQLNQDLVAQTFGTPAYGPLIALEGYSLTRPAQAPPTWLDLALYWRPLAEEPYILQGQKVFVQLRNNAGQTVAQADHFLYEGLLNLRAWRELDKQNELLRNTARFVLAQPLAVEGAPYSIYIGFYNPQTFERVPVVNDSSGENAIVLDVVEIP